jgi:hypothetical protein
MSRTSLAVPPPRMQEDTFATNRLRLKYLQFMWHVFGEAFFSEILKQEHAMPMKHSDSENNMAVTRNDLTVARNNSTIAGTTGRLPAKTWSISSTKTSLGNTKPSFPTWSIRKFSKAPST